MDDTWGRIPPTHRALPALALGLALGFGAAGVRADWNVSVGTANAHGTWSGGSPDVWTPNGSGATVAAAEITARLAGGTPVAINTSGGGGAENGDITVSSGFAWSANGLTFHAARNIVINASLNGSGTASLALEYGQGVVAAGNTALYTLGGGAKVSLPAGGNFSSKLGSDGGITTWTVITSLGLEGDASMAPTPMTLQGMNTGLAGNYVLGADIDASSTAGWNSGQGFTPVGLNSGTPFTGKFDGFGHTISGLTISRRGQQPRLWPVRRDQQRPAAKRRAAQCRHHRRQQRCHRCAGGRNQRQHGRSQQLRGRRQRQHDNTGHRRVDRRGERRGRLRQLQPR